MNDEQDRAEGKLLSRLLIIRSDLQEVNKKCLDKETREIIEGIEGRIKMLIRNLVQNKQLKD